MLPDTIPHDVIRAVALLESRGYIVIPPAPPYDPKADLTPEEIEEAKRLWAGDPGACIASAVEEGYAPMGFNEAHWIAFCQWCCEEYGASPFG
jgi:hypothetical protein